MLGTSDQVVVSGTTGLSATCPAGRHTLFGVGMQHSTDDASTGCMASTLTACSLGATSCAMPSCTSNGVDQAILFLACSASAALTDTDVSGLALVHQVFTPGDAVARAACPPAYAMAWGHRVRLAEQPLTGGATDACMEASLRACPANDVGCGVPACATDGVEAAAVTLVCLPSAVALGREHVTLSGLSAEQEVSVRVRAFNFHGSSDTVVALRSSATTRPDPAVSLAKLSATGGMMKVGWSQPSDSGGMASPAYEVGIAAGACPTLSSSGSSSAVVTDGLDLWLDAGHADSYNPAASAQRSPWVDMSGTRAAAGATVPDVVVSGTFGEWQSAGLGTDTGSATVWTNLDLDRVGALRVVAQVANNMSPQSLTIYSVSVNGRRLGNLASLYGRGAASITADSITYVFAAP